MKIRGLMLFLLVIVFLTILQPLTLAQSSAGSSNSPSTTAALPATPQPSAYVRPSEKTKLHNYLFDAFGPYPILGAAVAAGINQSSNSPPEWMQGGEGYGKRFGSNFGIAAISTTTRYALAEALREDTLYYPCECKGFAPRLGHALISTLTARTGADGHRVFSVPALVAPYAGTLTAVYAWYPDRYNGMDAFRMGNYVMLGYAGVNVAMEFLFSGPHSLGSRLHIHSPHSAPPSDPTH